MGSSSQRAQQSRHLQSRTSQTTHGYQRHGVGEQQCGGHGAEAITILAEAGEEVLVGGRGIGKRRRRRGQAEGVDTESVDPGDGK